MNKNGLSFSDRSLLYGWIQSQRCDNYAAHFAARAFIHSMQPEDVEPLAHYADLHLPFPILNILGAACVKQIQMAFASWGFGQWAPDTVATVERKGSNTPLIDTAQLRRSIAWKVEEK